MPKRDDAAPDHSLPLFLSGGAGEPRLRRSTRPLKVGILLLAVVGLGAATLMWGDPLARLAVVKAALVGMSTRWSDNDRPAAPAQSPTEAQTAAPPAEAETSSDQGAAAVPQAAGQKESSAKENTDVLFQQFQEWAAQEASKQDSQAALAPESQSPVAQDRPEPPVRLPRAARPMQTMRIPVEPYGAAPAAQPAVRAAPKQQPARDMRNARAEIDAAQRARAKAAQAHGATTRPQSPQDVRGQEAAPGTQPSLRQLFGVHN